MTNPTDPQVAHWHGFTQMSDHDSLVIEKGDGCWLTTTDGRRLFDGVSSLWCNVHGHRNPKLDAAIREQLDRVAHVTTLGMSCETTERLARRLAEITPGDLSHVFFSSDGSSAVEAALKMAFQYWQQREDPRPEKTNYLALGSAYHGDTTGAVSLGGIEYFHKLFAPILFSPVRGPVPCSYRLPPGVTSDPLQHYADEIESLLHQHHGQLAAVVMEPLVQGAAGMITHPRGLLGKVRKLCDRYDVLLICDEVATGFGRTGKMFACDHESVTPDILCIGKGLTGGYLPMAATVARPHVFDAFLAPVSESRQFFHGHTFGGNPLAAAAALASIELLEESALLDRVSERGQRLRDRLSDALANHPNVGDIRGRGMMIGIELVADRSNQEPFSSALQVGRLVCRRTVKNGVWIRPLGDVIILMPPLIATEKELDMFADVVIESVDAELATLSKQQSVSLLTRE
ncbi:MAG: adenosylmethionine--8-amino-7-oxononanoate transaminase [Rubripirellula sp.]|nr:adenosylmethionine--8-amino-7-oxononanoate transaminase [Rubripirellula sp.]|tara:strand:- start:1170 stop:2546 length:1377 start_codon:yes stop_codon:yes gene_type:complete